MPDSKKRHVVSFEKMNALHPDLAAAFQEKYPKGFSDYLNDLVKYPKPDGTSFYAVTVEIPDALYLVKIKVKVDDYEDAEEVFKSEDGEDGEDGKRVILWNVPHKEELCTNCGELVEMARKIWSQKDWMPIEGYLGGIWDEDKKKEIGCVVLKLGEFGILILKKRWDTKI